MDGLKSIISSRLKAQEPLDRQVSAAMAVEAANSYIAEQWGKKGRQLAAAISYKNQILTVYCKSAIMAQEINFKKQRFIDFFAKKFSGKQNLKKIKIVITNLAEDEEPC